VIGGGIAFRLKKTTYPMQFLNVQTPLVFGWPAAGLTNQDPVWNSQSSAPLDATAHLEWLPDDDLKPKETQLCLKIKASYFWIEFPNACLLIMWHMHRAIFGMPIGQRSWDCDLVLVWRGVLEWEIPWCKCNPSSACSAPMWCWWRFSGPKGCCMFLHSWLYSFLLAYLLDMDSW